MWTIRKAGERDLDLIVRVDLEDEGVTPGYREGWGEAEALDHRREMAAFIVERDRSAHIAESEAGGTIGVALWRFRSLAEGLPEWSVFRKLDPAVFPPDGRFCEIFQLWVEPAYRRQGIATALKRAAEDDCRARRVRLIYAHTEERNTHVLALNRKLGYREVRRGPIWDDVVRVSLVKNLEPKRL